LIIINYYVVYTIIMFRLAPNVLSQTKCQYGPSKVIIMFWRTAIMVLVLVKKMMSGEMYRRQMESKSGDI
jgi:hypothetical protein